MKCRVRINKHALNYFRKKAKDAQPKEIQAFLIGRVISPELTIVDEVHYTKEYAEQSSSTVRWWMNDYEIVKKGAEERGLRVVGDLHSHPNWLPIMSSTDYRSHIEEGFRICGICSVIGRKTKVFFWTSESALPCCVEHEAR
jgi:proteasome lid subunit RPN8/RPN11